ncbi:hypothetical protein AF435_04495 [Listeria monocytogenes]|uniref:DUF8208 domain-containing protein n=1 Tax=Listeria monocytogenes TaxID=1639 RepID=A0AAN3BBD4_LISMN|nr:hypothetical protein [Listeria monocytogenes]EAC3367750.1 hypothetical protein [Listeria monocytogenes]EAC7084979.1 hypothetical protein [Listeria monocytogenes]EAC8542005.1 hypothetical protein [Listeria monocytogenes]EAC8548006.1 hypothetical protein [Listeria monocytogenes]
MSNDEILKYLIQFSDYLNIASWVTSILRSIGLWILRSLSNFIDILSQSVSKIYGLLDFYNSSQVRNFIEPYLPYIFMLGTIALIYLGYDIMVKGRTEGKKYLQNFMIAVTLFIGLPYIMSTGTQLLMGGAQEFNNNESASLPVFQHNITDLYTVDKTGWKKAEPQNTIQEKDDLKFLDIGEAVDTGGWLFDNSPLSGKGKDILSKKVNVVDNKKTAVNLKSYFVRDDEAYFRYSWHPFFILMELVAKALVYFFVLFKAAKLIMELGFLNIFARATALTEFANDQRNKQVFLKIRNTYIVLFLILILIKVFDLWTAYLSAQNLDFFVRIIATFAGAWVTIDGPNIIQELFGIDAGLSSISHGILGFTQGATALKNIGSSAKNVAKNTAKTSGNVARGVGKGALYAGSAGKGILDGFKSSYQNPQQDIDNFESSRNPSTGITDNTTTENKGPSQSESEPRAGQSNQMDSPQGTKLQANTLSPQNEKTEKSSSNNLNHDKTGSQSINPDMRNVLSDDKTKKISESINQGRANYNKTSKQSQSEKALQSLLNPSTKIETGISSFPKMNQNQLPKNVRSAQTKLQEDMQPRMPDSDTLGDKAVGAYVNIANKVYHSEPVRKAYKTYDISKNTTQSLRQIKKE